MVERNEVAGGEVEDVDVVADGGAIFGGVIFVTVALAIAKPGHVFTAKTYHLQTLTTSPACPQRPALATARDYKAHLADPHP